MAVSPLMDQSMKREVVSGAAPRPRRGVERQPERVQGQVSTGTTVRVVAAGGRVRALPVSGKARNLYGGALVSGEDTATFYASPATVAALSGTRGYTYFGLRLRDSGRAAAPHQHGRARERDHDGHPRAHPRDRILRSIGVRARDIRRIFSTEGLVVALFGWLLGLPLGYALARGIIALTSSVAHIDLTFAIPTVNLAVTLIGTIVLALLVLLAPGTPGRALQARRSDPLCF